MKTPYLDASILLHEKASKINMLSKAGKASLIEFKKIKQALNIASVDCQLCADCESNEVYKNGLCFECQDRHPEI